VCERERERGWRTQHNSVEGVRQAYEGEHMETEAKRGLIGRLREGERKRGLSIH